MKSAFWLLGFATLFYVIMLWNAAALPYLESIDKGLAAIAALAALVLLWVLLGLLLIVGASKGDMPPWGAAAAFILHPLSGIAAGMALVRLGDRSGADQSVIVIMVVLPPLLAAYALWAHRPALHAKLPAIPTGCLLWGIAAAFSAGPVAYMSIHDWRQRQRDLTAERAYEAEQERQREAERAANLARFERLTPDSPLADWQDFIGKGNELEAQAIAGARALTRRQSDAEAMLTAGNGFPLFHISELDLHPTPAFCAATITFLTRQAADHRPTAPDEPFASEANYFDTWFPAMQWLSQQHCDLDPAVAAMEQAVNAYAPGLNRTRVLNALQRLRSEWRACDDGSGLTAAARIEVCSRLLETGVEGENRAVVLFDRAGGYFDLEQRDAAIRDYDAAIAINPNFAEAFNNRGNAYDDKGEHDRAIEDYDRAVAIAPAFAMAFSNRGAARLEKGELDAAIADFDHAISENPRYEHAWRNRGRARFFRGDFAAAEQDFAQALNLKPDDAYAVLWHWLALTRSGRVAADQLRRAVVPLDRAAWPWPIVATYLGEQDPSTVAAAARQDDADHVCEAPFYLGERAASLGDTTAARSLLQEAAAACPISVLEHYEAGLELARLPP